MPFFASQRVFCGLVLTLWGLSLCGCQRAYYAALEQLGYHKRDLLVSRVRDARDSQEEAKTHFQSALEKFSATLQVDGGALEGKYKQLKGELDRSEATATAVETRIEAVEDVSKALFKEWQAELEQYANDKLRRDSARQLHAARQRYAPLIRAMKRASAKMAPVLAAFRDQVLYLKHHLNARAIASLQGELSAIELRIDALIRDMEAAISEANAFIKAIDSA